MISLSRRLGAGRAPGLPLTLRDLAAAWLNASPLRLALDRARYGPLGWYVWQSRRTGKSSTTTALRCCPTTSVS